MLLLNSKTPTISRFDAWVGKLTQLLSRRTLQPADGAVARVPAASDTCRTEPQQAVAAEQATVSIKARHLRLHYSAPRPATASVPAAPRTAQPASLRDSRAIMADFNAVDGEAFPAPVSAAATAPLSQPAASEATIKPMAQPTPFTQADILRAAVTAPAAQRTPITGEQAPLWFSAPAASPAAQPVSACAITAATSVPPQHSLNASDFGPDVLFEPEENTQQMLALQLAWIDELKRKEPPITHRPYYDQAFNLRTELESYFKALAPAPTGKANALSLWQKLLKKFTQEHKPQLAEQHQQDAKSKFAASYPQWVKSAQALLDHVKVADSGLLSNEEKLLHQKMQDAASSLLSALKAVPERDKFAYGQTHINAAAQKLLDTMKEFYQAQIISGRLRAAQSMLYVSGGMNDDLSGLAQQLYKLSEQSSDIEMHEILQKAKKYAQPELVAMIEQADRRYLAQAKRTRLPSYVHLMNKTDKMEQHRIKEIFTTELEFIRNMMYVRLKKTKGLSSAQVKELKGHFKTIADSSAEFSKTCPNDSDFPLSMEKRRAITEALAKHMVAIFQPILAVSNTLNTPEHANQSSDEMKIFLSMAATTWQRLPRYGLFLRDLQDDLKKATQGCQQLYPAGTTDAALQQQYADINQRTGYYANVLRDTEGILKLFNLQIRPRESQRIARP